MPTNLAIVACAVVVAGTKTIAFPSPSRGSAGALARASSRRSGVVFDAGRPLFGMIPRDYDRASDDGGGGEGGSEEEVEAARRRLEELVKGGDGGGSSDSESNRGGKKAKRGAGGGAGWGDDDDVRSILDVVLEPTRGGRPPPPPLTTTGRERKLAEIELLSRLERSEEGPLEGLWDLWYRERGPDGYAQLREAERLTLSGRADEAESILVDAIAEHGVHWVEPINRLATLRYVQGRLKESKRLCEAVLSVKPWHFGALSGIVMVCAGLGDAVGARMWAARRLPPLVRPEDDDGMEGTTKSSGGGSAATDGGRRRAWVERAVRDAMDALEEAERATERAFGEREGRPREITSGLAGGGMDHDEGSSVEKGKRSNIGNDSAPTDGARKEEGAWDGEETAWQ